MASYDFRPVTADDLPMLARWLAHPEVSRWWPGPDRQIALIREDLPEAVMTQLVVSLDDLPIGYAQHYRARQWPAPHFDGLPDDTVAIDLFNAPEGFGHGGKWLRQLGDELLDSVSTLAIDPGPDNLRAIRAYQRAGFSGDAILTDAEGQKVRLMTRRRERPRPQ